MPVSTLMAFGKKKKGWLLVLSISCCLLRALRLGFTDAVFGRERRVAT